MGKLFSEVDAYCTKLIEAAKEVLEPVSVILKREKSKSLALEWYLQPDSFSPAWQDFKKLAEALGRDKGFLDGKVSPSADGTVPLKSAVEGNLNQLVCSKTKIAGL